MAHYCYFKCFDLYLSGKLLISHGQFHFPLGNVGSIPSLAAQVCTKTGDGWKATLLVLMAALQFSSSKKLLASWKNVSALTMSCYQTCAGCSFYS